MFGPDCACLVVVGAQWGDEGKGKLVDVLAETADQVVRYQGGANAGHTVVIGDEQFILQQIPSGILHAGTRCIVGNGVVLDPETFFEELDRLEAKGITTAVKAEMKLVAQNNLIMIVKRWDGTYWLYGKTKGMNLDAATSGITKEANGFKGHTWTFTGVEPSYAVEVDSAIITALLSPA